jgi:hypothetical protein
VIHTQANDKDEWSILKIGEMQHAWSANQITPRRALFLWTADMIALLRPEHSEPNWSGRRRYQPLRLTQAETPLEVRKAGDVLQWIVVDRNGGCIRYSPALCQDGAPEHKDAVKAAKAINEAIEPATG